MIDKDLRLMIKLVILILITFFSFLSPTTFYPDIAIEKGLPIFLIGIFNSIYSVGGFLTSLYLGIHVQFYNRKDLLIKGGYILSLSFFLLSLNIFVNN